jgi:TPP-dependent pyruvate/acetoin dehydrogenase alpha subunit
MTLLRAFEEVRLALGRAGRLPDALFSGLGQEATAVGLTGALAPGDRVFASRRGLALRLAAGLSVPAALREASCAPPGLGTPAGHLPIAVGATVAAGLAGGSAACIVEFGDGAASMGLYHESVQMALRWRAPVLFACVNNGYAGAEPSTPEATAAAVAAAAGLGMPVAQVDGQDAVAVLEATRALLVTLRSLPGPALIECRTYRVAPHVQTPGVPAQEGRPAAEIDFWRNRDPLRRFRALLLQDGHAHVETLDLIASTTRAEVAEAAGLVFGSAPPARTMSLVLSQPSRPGDTG